MEVCNPVTLPLRRLCGNGKVYLSLRGAVLLEWYLNS